MAFYPSTAKQAEREFLEAVRLEPHNADVHYQFGLYYKAMQRALARHHRDADRGRLNPRHKQARAGAGGDVAQGLGADQPQEAVPQSRAGVGPRAPGRVAHRVAAPRVRAGGPAARRRRPAARTPPGSRKSTKPGVQRASVRRPARRKARSSAVQASPLRGFMSTRTKSCTWPSRREGGADARCRAPGSRAAGRAWGAAAPPAATAISGSSPAAAPARRGGQQDGRSQHGRQAGCRGQQAGQALGQHRRAPGEGQQRGHGPEQAPRGPGAAHAEAATPVERRSSHAERRARPGARPRPPRPRPQRAARPCRSKRSAPTPRPSPARRARGSGPPARPGTRRLPASPQAHARAACGAVRPRPPPPGAPAARLRPAGESHQSRPARATAAIPAAVEAATNATRAQDR